MSDKEKFDKYRQKWLEAARKEIVKFGGEIVKEINLDFFEDEGKVAEAVLKEEPNAKAVVILHFKWEGLNYSYTIPFARVGQPLPAEIGTLVDKQMSQITLHRFARGWQTNGDDALKAKLDGDKQLKKTFRKFYNRVQIGNTYWNYEYDMQTVGYDDNTTYIGARPGISAGMLYKTCGIMDAINSMNQLRTHFEDNVGQAFGIRYEAHFGKVHYLHFLEP